MLYQSDAPPGTKRSTSFFQLSAVTSGIATASQKVKLVSSCALNLRLAVFWTAKSPRLTAECGEKLYPLSGACLAKRSV